MYNMDLPTYIYSQMTPEEKQIITQEITHPVVIRGLYQPKARRMPFEKVTKMFGHTELPIEIYDTPNTSTTSGIQERCPSQILSVTGKKGAHLHFIVRK